MIRYVFILFIFSCLLASSLSAEESRLLRYPNSSKTEIVFTKGGDLYTVPINGGIARKLTNSDGSEIFPRFSPDGNTIAFSGEYDGNREIYTMPSTGGEPVRVTYSMDVGEVSERMGPDKIIMQWTNDGSRILYRARFETWNSFIGKLYYVSKNGGLPEELPLPRGGFASLSPDGSKLAYNRIFREFRTWKRYRGGMADDIWIYDFKTKSIENITNNDAQDIIPMWYGNKIYFISDRDKIMNLYVYDLTTKQTKKLTDFKEFDIKFPSLGAEHIAFENGGYIYLMDLATEQVKKVTIEVDGDFPWARTKIQPVKDNIYTFDISHDGKRAVFTARGDIFTVPAEKGNIRNLTNSPGVHDRNAAWSPDGKWIAFISDRTGEDEIYIMKGDGSDVIQMTQNSKSYRFDLTWSPDSKKILSSDKAMRLYYIDITTKQEKEIAKSNIWEITSYSWSPDSKWVAYVDSKENEFNVVYLYSLETGKIQQVTNEYFNSYAPVFDPAGKYLYFLSNRTFSPELGNFEMSYTYNEMTKIYGLALQDTLKSPFAFESDEVKIKEDDAKKDDKKEKKKKSEDEEAKDTKSKDIKIDLNGLADRIFELPVPNGNYFGLAIVDPQKLYYVRHSSGKEPQLYAYDFEKKKEITVGSMTSYVLSADGKKILFRSGPDWYIEKLDESVKPDKGKLNLAEMKVNLNKREEWKQIFTESWRQMRDFFYDPNMHGVDWKAIREKYAQLLPYAVHRSDLLYIISEMISELNVGHAYTGGGDMPKIAHVPIGLLGATFQLDKASGFYKITKIYEGRNWDEETRSPLTEPGVFVKAGDYLVSIDGQPLSAENHPYKLLVDKAGKYVKISVNSSPSITGAKEYEIKTIKSESGLVYYNWVEENRRKVDSITGGKIAYVHIPNMGIDGLNEFVKYFYPQVRKEALIVDDRYNGGGFVSQMILERLRRVLTMAAVARNQNHIGTYPDAVFTGPMVCLINEFSASDGDIFPYNFKQNNLGKVIGKRSWGGVVGIRGSLPFLDGGYLNKPEFSHFGVNGKWILEGVGMEPDIIVDNDPAKEFSGIDEQLNKAIEVLREEMKAPKKPKLPENVPPYPDKK